VKESLKKHVLGKSISDNNQWGVKTDPNYPTWANSDQSVKLGGVIRITPGKFAIPLLPHLFTHFLFVLI
jgi:hypothetical protein